MEGYQETSRLLSHKAVCRYQGKNWIRVECIRAGRGSENNGKLSSQNRPDSPSGFGLVKLHKIAGISAAILARSPLGWSPSFFGSGRNSATQAHIREFHLLGIIAAISLSIYHASEEEQIMIIYLVMFALLIIIQILISLGWLKKPLTH